MLRCVMLTLLVVLLSPAQAATQNEVLDVKFGLNDLGDDQQGWLWKQIEAYASFEYTLQVCGKSSGIEKRMIAAVRGCVTQEALKRVIDYWHQRLLFEARTKAKFHLSKGPYCSNAKIQEISNIYLSWVARDVSKAGSLCNDCSASGLCN